MVRISASILGFYFEARQKKESSPLMVEKINTALKEHAKDFDMLHYDIEDGSFVPHKSFTPEQLRKIVCPKKKEAHFMVVNYKKYLKEYFMLADMFIFHHEVLKRDFPETIASIKKNKKYVGISLSPDTPVDELHYLDKIDLVLVMSVYPGLPGQPFIETSVRKIKKLNMLRKKNKYKYQIAVDGGINDVTAKKCVAAGADILVMGTHLFRKK